MGWLKGFIVAAAIALGLPAQAQGIVCHDPLKPMLRVELYFGRDARATRSSATDNGRDFWRKNSRLAFPMA